MADILRAFIKKSLPGVIRRPLADFVYRCIAILSYMNLFALVWRFSISFCPLLNKDKRNLSKIQKIKIYYLNVFLHVNNLLHKYYYNRFENTRTLSCQKADFKGLGVTLITGSLGPGGAERQVITTLLGLERRGYKPLSLACSYLREEVHRFFLPHLDNTNVHVTELVRDLSDDHDPHFKLLAQCVKKVPAYLKKDVLNYMRTLYVLRPNIVHFWLDETNIKGGMAAVVLGIPRIILSLRSLPPYNFLLHKPYFHEGYRWLAKQAGVVLVNNSEAGARAYEKWLELPKGTIQVVRNGFDFDSSRLAHYKSTRESYRAKYNIEGATPLFGTVIRLSEEKRPLLWLEIAAEVRKKLPSAQFLIVGNGPLYAKLVARSEQDDLRGSVHFAGYEKNALAAIAAMDIFLLTSRVEGLPNVLVEAQALGVPVVTTNVGGAPETLLHEITGWVLEQDDVQYATDILVRLMQDKLWLKNARNKAPDFVQTTFSIERMIDETLSLYQMKPTLMNDVNSGSHLKIAKN